MSPTEPRLAPIVFDTASLPEAARLPAWQAALESLDIAPDSAEPFAGHATLWLLETLVMIHAIATPLRYTRDEERIRSDVKDHIAVIVVLEGVFTGDYGYGETVSPAGSMTLVDLRRPFHATAPRLESIMLSLPRPFLIPQIGDADPHGLVVTGGFAALLIGFLRMVEATLPALTREQAPILAQRIRDLVVDGTLDAWRSAEQPRARNEAIISRVRSHIDAHLDTPLDVAGICAALGLSRSRLYRAFGGGGGVVQQIQRRRLHALRTLLLDPQETRSIAELVAIVGFSDKSHLTRVFKREYGCTPGEFRARRGQVEQAVAVDQVPFLFGRWATRLD